MRGNFGKHSVITIGEKAKPSDLSRSVAFESHFVKEQTEWARQEKDGSLFHFSQPGILFSSTVRALKAPLTSWMPTTIKGDCILELSSTGSTTWPSEFLEANPSSFLVSCSHDIRRTFPAFLHHSEQEDLNPSNPLNFQRIRFCHSHLGLPLLAFPKMTLDHIVLNHVRDDTGIFSASLFSHMHGLLSGSHSTVTMITSQRDQIKSFASLMLGSFFDAQTPGESGQGFTTELPASPELRRFFPGGVICRSFKISRDPVWISIWKRTKSGTPNEMFGVYRSQRRGG